MLKTCSVCDQELPSGNQTGMCFAHYQAAAQERRNRLRERVEALFIEEGLPFKAIAARLGISTRYARDLTDLRRPYKTKTAIANPIISDIVAVTADTLGVSVEQIVGRVRVKRYANARQIAYLIAREQGFSFPDIARATGRDHTTVLYGTTAIAEKAARNPALAARIDLVRKRYAKAAPGFSDRLRSQGASSAASRSGELPLDLIIRNAEMARSSGRFLQALRLAA